MSSNHRVAALVSSKSAVFDVVTDQKNAVFALRESELRQRRVLAALGEGVFGVDREGRCTFVNPAALSMVGLPESEVLGQDTHTLFHHSDCNGQPYPRAECPVHQTTQDGRIRHVEDWFIRKDGSCFPVDLIVTPLEDNGELAGAVVALQDISERKEAEARIRKLSLAVEQSPESIVITDTEANIEYVNDAFLAISGYNRDDVLGRNPNVLKSGRTPPERYQELWAALAEGRAWKGEFSNRRKDGSEYVEFAMISPIRQPNGRITHYLAIKEDITEKKRIGEELGRHRHHLEELVAERTAQLAEARERAEFANSAKSAFLANMSHEIRTPMNAIVGFTNLLRRAGTTPQQAVLLVKIDAAARHLLAIVNDILDLSKIEAGRIELEQTDFSLEAVMDGVRSLISEQARDKGLVVEVDRGDVTPWLRGDPTARPPGAAQLRSQRREVYRTGLREHARPTGGRPGQGNTGTLRGAGYRDRHRCGQASGLEPGIRAGRCLDHSPVRRHRSGSGHHPRARPTHGW